MSIKVPKDIALDAQGNLNEASESWTMTFDGTPPSASLTTTASIPTNGASVPISLDFSEPIQGLTASMITASAGTVQSLLGNGTQYSFDLALPPGSGSIAIDFPNGLVADAAGNSNQAATTLTVTYDRVRPQRPCRLPRILGPLI